TTSTLAPFGNGSSDHARKASLDPRTVTNTSPAPWSPRVATVSVPTQPIAEASLTIAYSSFGGLASSGALRPACGRYRSGGEGDHVIAAFPCFYSRHPHRATGRQPDDALGSAMPAANSEAPTRSDAKHRLLTCALRTESLRVARCATWALLAPS